MPKKTSKTIKAAADRQARVPLCNMPDVPERPLALDIGGRRATLIRIAEKKWVNGTVLHYCFLDKPAKWSGGDDQKDAVRAAFLEWKELGIGLEFVEVNDAREAEIRIGFEQGAGSWSYVGRDSIDYASDPVERTMNFGWDLTDEYGWDTALHEVGHAIGFSHEHQNPKAGILWDEAAVLEYFAGPPNYWPEETTRHNILRKLTLAETGGSEWDKDSIMHYRFPPGLIEHPPEYQEESLIPEPGLSRVDIAEVKKFFPPMEQAPPELRPFESRPMEVEPGGQLNFVIHPEYSRNYTFQTFGNIDTVMVLFEEINGRPVYYHGDDDSGYKLNARINARLFRGRTYILRIRLYYARHLGEGGLMMW